MAKVNDVDFNPKKLPLYWRKFGKMQKLWCRMGLHVPVRMDYDDGSIQVVCQECVIELTLCDHFRFFRKARGGREW